MFYRNNSFRYNFLNMQTFKYLCTCNFLVHMQFFSASPTIRKDLISFLSHRVWKLKHDYLKKKKKGWSLGKCWGWKIGYMCPVSKMLIVKINCSGICRYFLCIYKYFLQCIHFVFIHFYWVSLLGLGVCCVLLFSMASEARALPCSSLLNTWLREKDRACQG